MAKLHVKGKPRGDPSAILPYRWKKGQSGNPLGRSREKRVSDAIIKQLAIKNEENITRAEAIASNLLDRAETDSNEIEFVLNITEPGLLAPASGATAIAKVAIVDTFDDGTTVVAQVTNPVRGQVESGANGNQPAAGANGSGKA